MKIKTNILCLAFAVFAFACFAFVENAQAVVPAPDGGYPGGNTAEGNSALLSLTTGTYNTAIGIYSLLSLTEGNFCTGVGAGTLLVNTADGNTATGAGALLNNTAGTANTADGAFALFNNAPPGLGHPNTPTGVFIGSFNTATGSHALFSNTSGNANTGIGEFALFNNTTGGFNTALGHNAGFNLTTGSDNIYIDNSGNPGESDTIRIGSVQQSTFIAGIFGANVSGSTVVVNSDGQLGVATSSRRFKKEIKPMSKASHAILALKPVTFQYRSDKTGMPQFGLIAEEVAKVNPDLVTRDANGKVYTVRYEAVNAMLLNEFLKQHRAFLEEHRKVEEQGREAQEQQATIAKLKSTVARQQKEMETVVARLKEQDSKIQNVSAEVEMGKFATGRIRRGGPAPRMVLNP